MKCEKCGKESDSAFCPYCGAELSETPPLESTTENTKEKAKKPLLKQWWFWVAAAFVVIAIVGVIFGTGLLNGGVYTTELTNGYYIAGTDFPPGTYDIEVTGNFEDYFYFKSSDESIELKYNDEDPNYTTSYTSVSISQGEILSVYNVKATLTSEDADKSIIIPRVNTATESVTLTTGTYTSGTDIEPGYYDIKVSDGFVDLYVLNVEDTFDGLMYIFMGSDETYSYPTEFKNVNFAENTELYINYDGSATVQFTPSN